MADQKKRDQMAADDVACEDTVLEGAEPKLIDCEGDILEQDSRGADLGESELEGEVSLVLGDEGEHDADLHEEIVDIDIAWRGKIFNVERMNVRLPNGHASVRDVVRHPGAAAIVALTTNGKIVLVRQYRTALDRVTVEIPAGKLDPGEDPLECAKRELLEETGFSAGRIAYLTTIATSCGFSDELINIYLATQLEFAGANPDDDEFLNVDLVPVNELVDAVLDGKIEDAKTVVGALACEVMAHRLAEEAADFEDVAEQ